MMTLKILAGFWEFGIKVVILGIFVVIPVFFCIGYIFNVLLHIFVPRAESRNVWVITQDHSDANFVAFLATESVLVGSLDVKCLHSDGNNLQSPVFGKMCFHT